MAILTADWHLTDKPEDAYRWRVFDELDTLLDRVGEQDVYILGDLGDKVDHHSGTLVNRLLDRLLNVQSNARSVHIIMGNHDSPKSGAPYWNILSNTWRDIFFHSKPTIVSEHVMLLPYTSNPSMAWHGLDWEGVRAGLMHQPLKGAVENGRNIRGTELPLIPRGIKLYSGDIHTPQTVRRVEYVGAPHHVRYGDTHPCRMLLIDDRNWTVTETIMLHPPVKQIVAIDDPASLLGYGLQAGDQVRVRLKLPAADLPAWPAREAAILEWASRSGVHVASVEAIIVEQYDRSGEDAPLTLDQETPYDVLGLFAASEGLADNLVEVGELCLTDALKANGA